MYRSSISIINHSTMTVLLASSYITRLTRVRIRGLAFGFGRVHLKTIIDQLEHWMGRRKAGIIGEAGWTGKWNGGKSGALDTDKGRGTALKSIK